VEASTIAGCDKIFSTGCPTKCRRKTAGAPPTGLLTRRHRGLPAVDIGYPKLFMICERAIGKHAQQIVNNFAANRAATVSDWPVARAIWQELQCHADSVRRCVNSPRNFPETGAVFLIYILGFGFNNRMKRT
jgi:hypothetical protein